LFKKSFNAKRKKYIKIKKKIKYLFEKNQEKQAQY